MEKFQKFAVNALCLEAIRPKRSRPREPGRAARVTRRFGQSTSFDKLTAAMKNIDGGPAAV